jgi:hypothetical protein
MAATEPAANCGFNGSVNLMSMPIASTSSLSTLLDSPRQQIRRRVPSLGFARRNRLDSPLPTLHLLGTAPVEKPPKNQTDEPAPNPAAAEALVEEDEREYD